MGLQTILFNNHGRLRSGWRLALYVIALFAFSFVLTALLRVAYLAGNRFFSSLPFVDVWVNAVFRLGELGAALAAGYVCVRLLEGLPWRSLGLTLHKGWGRDLIVGSAIGFAALAFAVGIAAAGGGLRFSFIGTAMLWATGKSLISFGLLFLLAALAEEAVFRGYPLQTLTRAGLVWFGVILTSLPFGLAHLL